MEQNQTNNIETTKTPQANPLLIPLSIIIAGALIAGALIYSNISGGKGAATSASGATLTGPFANDSIWQGAFIASNVTLKLDDNQHSQGNKDSKVAIVEFSDYDCPFCAQFHAAILPSITKDYISNNKVNFIYKDLINNQHAYSLLTEKATRCAADQNKYWEMADKIFMTSYTATNAQQELKHDQPTLEQYAKDLGLDSKVFNDCLNSTKHEDELQKSTEAANSLQFSATPSFLIGVYDSKTNTVTGDTFQGSLPYKYFQYEIDKTISLSTSPINSVDTNKIIISAVTVGIIIVIVIGVMINRKKKAAKK